MGRAPEPRRVPMALAGHAYDILVGDGLIAGAAAHLAPLLARPRTCIVTDETVARHHLEPLAASLAAAGIAADRIVLPAGEKQKSFAGLERLTDRLLDLRLERRDVVIALGGGVIGDLVGFAAAVLRRGMPFVQVPTTLLAQVDSSVGGKTAINTRQGKNLVGAFHQPRLVLADTGALATLPRRELLAGYAEVAKYGLLGDAGFFAWLEANGAAVLDGAAGPLAQAVTESCRAKAAIVVRDERETGDRALLNLGHTFGHALEAEAGYGQDLLHGEAVAIGMMQAFDLSVRLGLCPAADAARARRHLAGLGLPVHRAERGLGAVPAARLLDHMRQDKKVQDGRLTFVLVRGIGHAFVTRDVDEADVLALLAAEAAATPA